MNTVWILVCDSTRARLFETQPGQAVWTSLETATHEESRLKTSDLVSDRSGSRSSEGASAHHNALAPSSDPREVEKGHFAHSLVRMLDQGMRSGRFRTWVLVAAPHFMGMLKKELTPELKKHLIAKVDKDLMHLESRALAERLHDVVDMIDDNEVFRETVKHSH